MYKSQNKIKKQGYVDLGTESVLLGFVTPFAPFLKSENFFGSIEFPK